jgi:hypothetical protein
MWVRGIIGLAVCVVGVVWILQGLDLLHGSSMSGHVLYAALGAIAAALGAALLGKAAVTRRRAKSASAN